MGGDVPRQDDLGKDNALVDRFSFLDNHNQTINTEPSRYPTRGQHADAVVDVGEVLPPDPALTHGADEENQEQTGESWRANARIINFRGSVIATSGWVLAYGDTDAYASAGREDTTFLVAASSMIEHVSDRRDRQ